MRYLFRSYIEGIVGLKQALAEKFIEELMQDLRAHLPGSRIDDTHRSQNPYLRIRRHARAVATNHRKLIMLLAIHRAFLDLSRTSGLAKLHEEHQTASLMGHLATNLRWYAASFSQYCDENEVRGLLPSLRWAFLSKKTERAVGADFGIVVPTPVEGASTFRFVLVQAKREINRGKIDVSYPLTGDENDGVDPVDKLRWAMESKNLQKEYRLPVLQLQKFLAFEDQFRHGQNAQKRGCFYGVYRQPVSQTVPLATYTDAYSIARAAHIRRPDAFSLSSYPVPFAPLAPALAAMLIDAESDMGFDVNINAFSSKIPQILDLIPAINLILVNPSHELILQLQHVMKAELARSGRAGTLVISEDLSASANASNLRSVLERIQALAVNAADNEFENDDLNKDLGSNGPAWSQ